MISNVSDYHEKERHKLTNRNALGVARTATNSAQGKAFI
jgi:hypothetical protein